MDLKESERYYHGYILVPCCTEDYCKCQNQLQGFQAIPNSYPLSISKYDAILAEQSEHQATRATRFTSHRGEDDSHLFFPAIHKQRRQSREVSRHKVGVEGLAPSSAFKGT